ncbi:MAG: formylglycine-generating enzyme family protein [Pseudomonadota bacterium]
MTVRFLSTLSFLVSTCLSSTTSSVADTSIDVSALAPLETFQECDACPEMIVMPPGSFMMGAKPEDSRNPYDLYGENATRRIRGPDEVNIIPSEHPRHRVEMDIPFAMARNETTHAQWMACVEAGGCTHTPDHRVLTPRGYRALGPDHPAVNVSYLDALEYTAWLNTLVGDQVYRLPTEAEWEYAARAGTDTRFAQGDDLTAEQANFSRRATEHLRGRRQEEVSMPELANRRMPVPVHELDAANGWGLRHMSGNVAEVTLSCWAQSHLGLPTDSAYLAHAEAHATCPLTAEASRRVAKGGDYGSAMDLVRPAWRSRPTEDRRRSFRGFRVIREFTERGD